MHSTITIRVKIPESETPSKNVRKIIGADQTRAIPTASFAKWAPGRTLNSAI